MTHGEDGATLIAQERERQMAEEGWTAMHDDGYKRGELATAAACYAIPELLYVQRRTAASVSFVDPWPLQRSADKRRDQNGCLDPPFRGPRRVRMLVRAGALIAAEIDRLLRTAP